MNLSVRLSYIASFINSNMVIADIGSDHGFLPYYLLENKIIYKAYACDNKKGPFNNLKNTFKDCFKDQIELSLSDGLTNLPSYVNTIIMTGMGGDLIVKLLNRDKKYLSNIKYLILSPHSHIDNVRGFMMKIGYKLIDEGIVFDDKYYHILKYEIGNEYLSEKELYFGPILLKNKNELFKMFYNQKLNELLFLVNNKQLDENKKKNVLSEINLIKEEINEN